MSCDFSESDELVQFATKLISSGLSIFQVRKRLKAYLPGISNDIVGKVYKKAINGQQQCYRGIKYSSDGYARSNQWANVEINSNKTTLSDDLGL